MRKRDRFLERRAERRRRGSRRNLQLERLEDRTLLAADFTIARNPVQPMDVNNDGAVSPADLLMVFNDLNASHRPGHFRAGFMDVNGDRGVSPIDALMIVNWLNDSGHRIPQPAGPKTPPLPHKLEPRTIDGAENNLAHPDWGTAHSPLLRLTSAEYADGMSAPAGQERPSARLISNLCAGQEELSPNARGLSDLVWQWGQFLDHDIDLTDPVEPAALVPIEVPVGDAFFDPTAEGGQTIEFKRSSYDLETGGSAGNPRQQVNSITAFIDGSNVYGSDEERAAALRTFVGGRLKTSPDNLLPFNEQAFENAGGTSQTMFFAGDVRANEQVGLTAMHTLWVREHNRIADQISGRNAKLSDEEVYQLARSIVIAEIQAITFNEFLPALLGDDAIPGYEGYRPTVNPGISNVFSTAAYRFGHSMLSPELLRLDNNGEVSEAGNLALRDAFFNPTELTENGIDSILTGLAAQRAQEIDTHVVDDVRNFLFGHPGADGFDLASLNIQRGRDHGLADYNQVRREFGLAPAESFADITSDPELQAALEAAYGDTNSIDVWLGGLAEDPAEGGSVGELVRTVLIDQFTRLRDGDRFWYTNLFAGRDLERIENTTLADVIQRNTNATNLQSNVFFVPNAQPTDASGPDGQ